MKRDSVINILPLEDASAKKKQSVIRPNRRTPYRARRRRGGIRFFDLGWKKYGDKFATIPFVSPVAANPLQPNTPPPSNDSQLKDDTALTAAHYAARDALILDVPVKDWAKNFKQIKEAHTEIHTLDIEWGAAVYNLSGKNANWANGYFKPDGEAITSEQLKFGIFWNGWLTSGLVPSTMKITHEPNFAADEVEFIPQKRMDVFLMPGFLFEYAAAQERFTQSPTLNRVEYLNNLNIIGSRELDFDEAHPNYGQFKAAHSVEWYSDGTSSANYTTAHAAVRYHQQKYPHRAIAILFDSKNFPLGKGYTFENLTPAAFADSGVFPSPPGRPSGSHSYFLTSYALAVVIETAGVLSGVIRQANKTYYFWTR